jgi:hypothetical protein
MVSLLSPTRGVKHTSNMQNDCISYMVSPLSMTSSCYIRVEEQYTFIQFNGILKIGSSNPRPLIVCKGPVTLETSIYVSKRRFLFAI